MQTTRTVALALAIAASWSLAVAAECIDPPRKPIRVSGALCGRASLYGETIPDVDLYLTQDNKVVARVRTDPNAGFTFQPLPKGNYTLTAQGFNSVYPAIELTSENAVTCKRPLFLMLQLTGDCRSHVTTSKPRD